ncbi:MAG: hypothetical protein OXU64_01430 [Gemmatimonadota bacterium]|nr:hypothetical protein [Gemmatimonadota bacterium]
MTATCRAGAATAVVLASLVPLGRPALAQSVGDRVRVTTPGQTAVGKVAEVGEHTLELRVPGGWNWRLARSEVERLEVSAGTRRATLWGLGIGIGAGLIVSAVRIDAKREFACNTGGTIGGGMWCMARRNQHIPPPSDREIMISSTAVAGAVGLLLGALVKRDVWETVSHNRAGVRAVDPVADVRYGPDGGPAVTLGTRIRF